jgi:hypothetical protein
LAGSAARPAGRNATLANNSAIIRLARQKHAGLNKFIDEILQKFLTPADIGAAPPCMSTQLSSLVKFVLPASVCMFNEMLIACQQCQIFSMALGFALPGQSRRLERLLDRDARGIPDQRLKCASEPITPHVADLAARITFPPVPDGLNWSTMQVVVWA